MMMMMITMYNKMASFGPEKAFSSACMDFITFA